MWNVKRIDLKFQNCTYNPTTIFNKGIRKKFFSKFIIAKTNPKLRKSTHKIFKAQYDAGLLAVGIYWKIKIRVSVKWQILNLSLRLKISKIYKKKTK